jgi:hypothetical protein
MKPEEKDHETCRKVSQRVYILCLFSPNPQEHRPTPQDTLYICTGNTLHNSRKCPEVVQGTNFTTIYTTLPSLSQQPAPDIRICPQTLAVDHD